MDEKDTSRWYLFTLLYLVIDYGRPQDSIPVIGYLKPGMIMILVLMWYLFSNNGIKNSNTNQTRMIWYFVLLLITYVPFARNNFYAYQAASSMASYLPFILSVVICVNSIERLKKLVNFIVILMIYISGYSLMHSGQGSGNYFQDENDVSLFIVTIIPICFFLFMYEKDKKTKLIYAVGLVVGLAAIVVSFSRGGFVGLVCAAFIMWYYSPRKIISIVLISVLSAGVFLFGGEKYMKEMETSTDTEDGTAKERILSWESAWKMFLDNPLGVGGDNFQVRFPEYQVEGFSKGMWGRAAHSLWFTLIPELGIFGILIFVRLLYFNIKDILYMKNLDVKKNQDLEYLRNLARAFLSSFAGFFAAASFLSVLYYPHYWYVTALIVVAAKLTKDIEKLQNNL